MHLNVSVFSIYRDIYFLHEKVIHLLGKRLLLIKCLQRIILMFFVSFKSIKCKILHFLKRAALQTC